MEVREIFQVPFLPVRPFLSLTTKLGRGNRIDNKDRQRTDAELGVAEEVFENMPQRLTDGS